MAVTQPACSPDGKPGGSTPGVSDTGPFESRVLPSGARVLDGVHLLDAAGARHDRALVLLGGEIWEERAAGDWEGEVEVVEGAGRWVVPGLIDAHVHLSLSGALGPTAPSLAANLRAQLAWGVTGVADLGGPEVLFDIRDAIERGELVGPRIFATGPFLTTPGSHPCEVVNDRDQCRFVDVDGSPAELVHALSRADGLKVALADAAFTPWPTPRLDLGDLAEIAAAAEVPIFAHTDTPEDVEDALANGVSVLAHPVFSAAGAPPPDAPVTSTLGAFQSTAAVVDGSLLADALHHTPDDVRADWAAVAADPELLGDAWLRASAQWSAAATANLEVWLEEGVPVVAGSDAGYLFVPHGLGLHRELASLEALGSSPLDALTAATAGPAALLGWDDAGWLAAGYRADFLILAGDPRDDVGALRAIDEVWQGGERRDVVDPVEPPAATEGAVCLEPAGCGEGLVCDDATWRCAAQCVDAWAVLDDCGPAACAETAAGEAVCRSLPDCSLLTSDCTPSWYGENCVPVDVDTNSCWPSGLAAAGEPCDWEGGLGGCGQGLYCSPIDGVCYAHCDPAGDDCGPTQRCEVQQLEGIDWFALCL